MKAYFSLSYFSKLVNENETFYLISVNVYLTAF